jgi:hypothetical protein
VQGLRFFSAELAMPFSVQYGGYIYDKKMKQQQEACPHKPRNKPPEHAARAATITIRTSFYFG